MVLSETDANQRSSLIVEFVAIVGAILLFGLSLLVAYAVWKHRKMKREIDIANGKLKESAAETR